MDAFLSTMLACALAEMGDRTQILCAALAIRFGRTAPVLGGLAAATALNCAIAGVAGAAVHDWISEEPLRLFLALSLVLAGVGMLGWRRAVDLLEGWRGGAFLVSFGGLFILQFGDKGQFILAANAARTDALVLAATGGWIGIMLACAPALFFQERMAAALPMATIRKVGGGLFLLIGAGLALSAWGVV